MTQSKKTQDGYQPLTEGYQPVPKGYEHKGYQPTAPTAGAPPPPPPSGGSSIMRPIAQPPSAGSTGSK